MFSLRQIRLLQAFATMVFSSWTPTGAQNIEWTRQFGTVNDNQAFGVSVNASGVYIGGATNEAFLRTHNRLSDSDAYVVKIVEDNTPENNSIVCSDGIDNDGDGLIDCLDNECHNLPNNGCQTCFEDGLSFADFVISFEPTCSSNTNVNPEAAIGVSDLSGAGTDVSLGEGGSITLGFNNNLMVNSGDSNPDIWVFEVGSLVEASQIELRPFDQNTINILNLEGIPDSDLDGYFDFGVIAGSTSSLDIDAIVIGYPYSELRFDAIQITDVPTECKGNTPGADIDAVCALSSLVIDCAGTLNGTAVIDDCGECLEPNDLNFNQACVDCAGTPNGTAVIDDCGKYLEPTDLNFNQACVDCADTPNGTAVIDDCGKCYEPTDPSFNQSCDIENQVYIPNAFSPNDDGLNDRFQVFKNPTTNAKVNTYLIFNRWGELIFESKSFEFNSNINWWNGEYKGQRVLTGVYAYIIEIEFQDDEIRKYTGGVTIIK